MGQLKSTVSPDSGTTPSRWTMATVPAKRATSRPIIQESVVRALRQGTGWKAGTALEIASIPVMAVEPDAKARITSSRPTPSTACCGGVGTGAKPRPAAW